MFKWIYERNLSRKHNSSETHPGTLPQQRALKTKINGCKSLRKIDTKSSNFNVTGFLDVPLITAYKKEKLLLKSFLLSFKSETEIETVVFSKGKKRIYNNYKCFMDK